MPTESRVLPSTVRSSRLRRLAGPHRHWRADNGCEVELPVCLELVQRDSVTGRIAWKVEATIRLVRNAPALTRMMVTAAAGIDPVYIQRFFRWATPLDVVRQTVPALIAKGRDPYAHDYAVDGYPDAADINARLTPGRRTDEFLEEVARQYLAIGRGYAQAIAGQRQVSQRTVVNWIQKARQRGILSTVPKGSIGGCIVPTAERRPRR